VRVPKKTRKIKTKYKTTTKQGYREYMREYMKQYRKKRKRQLERLGNILSQSDIELPPDLLSLFFGFKRRKRGDERRKK